MGAPDWEISEDDLNVFFRFPPIELASPQRFPGKKTPTAERK